MFVKLTTVLVDITCISSRDSIIYGRELITNVCGRVMLIDYKKHLVTVRVIVCGVLLIQL